MSGHKEEPSVSYWDFVMEEGNKGREIAETHVVDCYNKWALDGSYDKAVQIHGYGALNVLEEVMNRLFPSKKCDVTILDVGAGTGFAGQRLHQMGFRRVDALDPSNECLGVAEKKGVYNKLYNVPMTDQPLDIPENSYDGITVAGAMAPKHLPLSAFTEMIRLTKPGGYIVNLIRAEFLERCSDYVSQWDPVIQGHVTAGRWRLVEEEEYANHYSGRAGYKHVFQVC